MASPSNALVLRFSTDLTSAQKNITQFAAQAATNLATISSNAINAKKALDLLGDNAGKIKLAIGAVAGFEALKLAVDAVSAAAQAADAHLTKLVGIGSAASKAGVGTSFFQAWTGQAKALNLETGDLVAMLEHARQSATETIGEIGGTSNSKNADRIKQNVLGGYLPQSALTSYANADTEEQRIRVMLGLVEQLKQKGIELAAFDLGKTFFGPEFETQLRNGVDIIGKLRAAKDGLQSAGGERIIPPEEIENAKRMKAEMDAINDRIAAQMKPLLEEITSIEQGSLEVLIKIKSAFVDIVELVKDVGDSLKRWTVDPLLRGIMLDVQAFENVVTRPINNLLFGKGFLEGIAGTGQSGGKGPGIHLEYDGQGNPHTVSDADATPAITVHKSDPSRKGLPSLTPAASKAASPAAKTDQVETYINSLKKQTAAEEAEAQTLGLGNRARQEAVDLAKAQEAASERGSALTQAESDKVKALADSYIAAKDKIEAYAKAQENAKAQAEFFGGAIEGALERAVEPSARLQDVL